MNISGVSAAQVAMSTFGKDIIAKQTKQSAPQGAPSEEASESAGEKIAEASSSSSGFHAVG